MQHIRRLDVRDFLKHGHELRQIVEPCEPRLGPVAGALRGQLDGRHGLPERRRPGVEVEQAMFFQSLVLEVLLHGVELHHGVADGCTRGKNHAAPAGQLVQVAALHVEVAGLLGLGLANAAHVPHLGKCCEVFIVMCLVHEQAVYTQFFKGHHIILAALVVELFQLGLDRFPGAFQLLDGEPLPVVGLQLGQAIQNVPLLLLQDVPLALDRHGDFLKLGMSDNDGVKITGGNPAAESFAVFGLKVPPGRHQDVGSGIEL